MNKIELNELKELQNIKKDYNQLIIELGEYTLQENHLKLKKENLFNKQLQISTKEQEIKNKLIKKYGDKISINIDDGSY